MVVMKFGGTSLAGPAEIKLVGQIIKRFARRSPVIVVSALAGVTDELLALAEEAVAGRPTEVSQRLDRLQARHRKTARALRLSDGVSDRLGRELLALFSELEGPATACCSCAS